MKTVLPFVFPDPSRESGFQAAIELAHAVGCRLICIETAAPPPVLLDPFRLASAGAAAGEDDLGPDRRTRLAAQRVGCNWPTGTDNTGTDNIVPALAGAPCLGEPVVTSSPKRDNVSPVTSGLVLRLLGEGPQADPARSAASRASRRHRARSDRVGRLDRRVGDGRNRPGGCACRQRDDRRTGMPPAQRERGKHPSPSFPPRYQGPGRAAHSARSPNRDDAAALRRQRPVRSCDGRIRTSPFRETPFGSVTSAMIAASRFPSFLAR